MWSTGYWFQVLQSLHYLSIPGGRKSTPGSILCGSVRASGQGKSQILSEILKNAPLNGELREYSPIVQFAVELGLGNDHVTGTESGGSG